MTLSTLPPPCDTTCPWRNPSARPLPGNSDDSLASRNNAATSPREASLMALAMHPPNDIGYLNTNCSIASSTANSALKNKKRLATLLEKALAIANDFSCGDMMDDNFSNHVQEDESA